MKKYLLIVLPLLLIVGCSKPISEETLIDKDGLKYHPETKELYSGEVFKIRMGGGKELEGSYIDGEKDGLWTVWHENGQVFFEATYKNGKKNGLFTYSYKNGLKEIEGNFIDNKYDGTIIYYYENGEKKEQFNYINGERIGAYTTWYENGQKREEGNYIDFLEAKAAYEEKEPYSYLLSNKKLEKIKEKYQKVALVQWNENGQQKMHYSLEHNDTEILLNEKYNFDSSVKGIDNNRITIKIINPKLESEIINSFKTTYVPNAQGKVVFITMIDGQEIQGLRHEVLVKKTPSAPDCKFIRFDKESNNFILEITTYGNKNGKKAIVPLSGIYGRLELEQPEKIIGNRKVTVYSFELDEPQFGNNTEVRIKVVDKYKQETVTDNVFEYFGFVEYRKNEDRNVSSEFNISNIVGKYVARDGMYNHIIYLFSNGTYQTESFGEVHTGPWDHDGNKISIYYSGLLVGSLYIENGYIYWDGVRFTKE